MCSIVSDICFRTMHVSDLYFDDTGQHAYAYAKFEFTCLSGCVMLWLRCFMVALPCFVYVILARPAELPR